MAVPKTIESVDPAGKLHLSNVFDEYTGEPITYSETTEITSDSQADGIVFKRHKRTGKYLKRNFGSYVNLKSFGAKGKDNWFNDDAFIVKAIQACIVNKITTLILPAGFYRWSSKITVPQGFTIQGEQALGLGVNSRLGTFIYYTGSGIMIQTAEDDGLPEDQQLFNGNSNLTLRNITIAALGEGQVQIPGVRPYGRDNKYVPGSKCIVDRRGGGLNLDNVVIQGFEQGVWAYNSDFNYLNKVELRNCLTGLHLRAHSDQGSYNAVTIYGCLRAMDVYSSSSLNFNDFNIISCGSSSVNPVLISTSTNTPTYDSATGTTSNFDASQRLITFNNLWAEQNGGTSGNQTIEAFIELAHITNGVGQMTEIVINGVNIVFPFGASLGSTDDRRVDYLLKVGTNVKSVVLNNVSPIHQIKTGAILVTGASSPMILAKGADVYEPKFTLTNNGTGSPELIREGGRLNNRALQSGYNSTYTAFLLNNDAVWKKLGTVKINSISTFTGATYKIDVLDARGQWRSNSPGYGRLLTFWVSIARSGGVVDDNNTAFVYGNDLDFIRVVKLQTGAGANTPAIFEIQTRNPTAFADSRIEVREMSATNTKFYFEPLLPSGTTTGIITTYSPLPSSGLYGVNDATSTVYNRGSLNSTYPNAGLGFTVIQDATGFVYIKRDNVNGKWTKIAGVDVA